MRRRLVLRLRAVQIGRGGFDMRLRRHGCRLDLVGNRGREAFVLIAAFFIAAPASAATPPTAPTPPFAIPVIRTEAVGCCLRRFALAVVLGGVVIAFVGRGDLRRLAVLLGGRGGFACLAVASATAAAALPTRSVVA